MYKPTNNDFWTGRIDTEDGELGLRWHQIIQVSDLSEAELPTLKENQIGCAIIGFSCDEGVKRNKGRVGAENGPEAIRKSMANYAWHQKGDFKFFDCGDVLCEGSNLEQAQNKLADSIGAKILDMGYFPIILGGGHEVAFASYKGILKSRRFKDQSIGIINLDAHFDLRSYSTEGTSGTPFRQIFDLAAEMKQAVDYLCLGIQSKSNTQALFQVAEEYGINYLLAEELSDANWSEIEIVLTKFINNMDAIYLSIDMDVFDSSDAPGVSAPAIPGVEKQCVFRIIRHIQNSGKLILCDFAELNPRYDIDNKTAKLAAAIVYQLIDNSYSRP